MALSFSATANQFVNFGSATSLDNLTAGTIVAWFRCTSTAAENQMLSVKGNGAPGYQNFVVNGFTPGTLRLALDIGRATTGLQIVSGADAVVLNQWTFAAVVWDMAGSNTDQRLYVGSRTARVAEVASYAFQIVGSGAISDNAGGNYVLGNFAGDQDWSRYVGQMALSAIWNRALTLAEIERQQFRPHVTTGCVGFWDLHGTGTQYDQSGNGNHGTVTGATAADHVPLRGWNRRRSGLFVPYVVGGGPPPAVVVPRLLMLGVG
jgi:hypothetical protein